jgi:hypothetical protein
METTNKTAGKTAGVADVATETAKKLNKAQKEYVNAWHRHIDGCNVLLLTPSRALSEEVEQTLDKLRELVIRIAKDKKLGERGN